MLSQSFDVERNSGNITASTIAPLITSRTKAISVVHLVVFLPIWHLYAIWPHHMTFLLLKIVPTHGAKINDQSVGSLAM